MFHRTFIQIVKFGKNLGLKIFFSLKIKILKILAVTALPMNMICKLLLFSFFRIKWLLRRRLE